VPLLLKHPLLLLMGSWVDKIFTKGGWYEKYFR
jgi:hypothetical protein